MNEKFQGGWALQNRRSIMRSSDSMIKVTSPIENTKKPTMTVALLVGNSRKWLMLNSGPSLRRASKEFNVDQETIRKVVVQKLKCYLYKIRGIWELSLTKKAWKVQSAPQNQLLSKIWTVFCLRTQTFSYLMEETFNRQNEGNKRKSSQRRCHLLVTRKNVSR